MSVIHASPVSFPSEKPINKSKAKELLSKRSYVDSSSNALVLLQGIQTLPCTVYVPKKYSRILHIISYRYDVYRHATAAIQVAKTSCDIKLATQKLVRILHYLDDVRAAYITRARRRNATDETWFSPELEYHMWLDCIERAYHDAACASIEKRVGVTFEYVLQRKQPDISSFIKWDTYTANHNRRFDMCGLEINLGKKEPPVPQAAHQLAQAIIKDLEAADKRDKGEKATGVPDEGEEVNGKQKRAARSSRVQEKVEDETNTRGKPWRKVTETPLLADDRSANDSKMAAQNGKGGEQAESSNDGADIWTTRFGQLYTSIRNRLLHLCNIDANDLHDHDSLEAWHQSIDLAHPLACEILGYAHLLRSTAKLEQGADEQFQHSISTIGREYKAFTQQNGDNNGQAQKSERDEVREDLQGGNSGDEIQNDNGMMSVEVQNETHIERPDDMVTDQGTWLFLEMIARDTGMVHGLDLEPFVEVSKYGSDDGDDSTSTPTDAAGNRKRVSSMVPTLSERGAASKKNKNHDLTHNPLASITMESIFNFSEEIGSSGSGTGLEHHAPTPHGA